MIACVSPLYTAVLPPIADQFFGFKPLPSVDFDSFEAPHSLLPIPLAFFFVFFSYISLDVAEDEQGQRLVRVVFNGKEKVLPGAEGPWIPLTALQERWE